MIRASRELYHIDPALITIPEDRQRKMDVEIGDLIPSVRQRGIMLPLLLTPEHTLIAGWRRLQTALFLKLSEVPYRIVEGEPSTLDLHLIELEENARRKDLSWQDKASAMFRAHQLYLETNGEEWTVEQSALAMGYDEKHFYKMLDLGEAILDGDQSVIKAETVANAQTLLTRRRARQTDEAVQRILERAKKPAGVSGGVQSRPSASIERPGGVPQGGDDGAPLGDEPSDPGGNSIPSDDRPVEPPYAIISENTHEWVAGYGGEKFNFLHADLPYGVELNDQANQASFEGGGYESTADIYFSLMDSLLSNWEKFMLPSSHVMWWFAFKFRAETEARILEHLERRLKLDVRINPIPLIWHKTDNRGILADPMRGPRNIGEYALLISTGDRKIVKPVSNIYGAPTAKGEAIHTNEKPEPMLRYFFSMLVDGHSRVLDPTAGSGSAIRAAESLGAEAALGLEFNEEFASRAQSKLLQARRLRALSSVVADAKKEAAE